ncbi:MULTISPECIES: LLM class flavin-dependent oxidoreductase [Sphingobium]|uniref:LLM class flavin-dependent oxidoreductase n=2 Tax=Sphingobium TaxID=165695 RepID=A0A5B8CF73_SPHSA|nr:MULTISPECIES: LLM class flavin-dependent oxidoreductase [Sphingobium]OAP32241.1 oxidoreductase [Sphingobium sp. 20006FA]AJR25349.1 oxidoreductase [Sphingobium sp. YBL2]KXU33029.1 oxidoreductase [Sphingobium sp. AM]KYC33970.1 oxidoreductase [Sphingobium sp. 22B]QDC36916.1 LLM class flavin-dependent oxidoreductase [Sphingobium fuliginis ATCC 27551]
MTDRKAVWAQIVPMPGADLSALAQSYEAAGVEGVWAPQIFGAPFTTLAAVAPATQRIKLGTGIALAFVRSPLETACSAIDLDLISNGRVVLGLGSSAQSQIEGSFGSAYGKPLAHMREIVGMIRAIVARGHTGELTELAGDYHRLDLSHFRLLHKPVRSDIPIVLPAVFQKACAQAAEIADGLLGHPLWNDAWIEREVAAQIKAGLDRAGRARKGFSLNISIFTAISDDRREAIEDCRGTVAYYSQSPQYLRYFEEIGFGREASAIQAAFAQGDMAGMAAACSDEMVESIAVVGTVDEVRSRVARRAALADAITPVIPHYGLSPEKSAIYTQRIAEAFYG